jgi:hypothetical protein
MRVAAVVIRTGIHGADAPCNGFLFGNRKIQKKGRGEMKPSEVKQKILMLWFVCLALVFSSSLYAQTLVWSDE